MSPRVRRQNRSREKCLIWCIAVSSSVLYILIQNNLLLKNETHNMKIRTRNDLATTREARKVPVGNGTGSKILVVKKPLIYMFTTRLHTPLNYDETCEITRDPALFQDSHAVVFHAKDLPISNSLAKLRSKAPVVNQLWVYFNLESPVHTRRIQENEMLFNFTITPLRNSDLYHPYGYHFKRAGTDSIAPGSKKTRFIAWCVSNCKVKFRNEYIRLMQKYTSVDIYGGCSALFGAKSICRRGSLECSELLATYKFYLAFENSLCQDYNTEKYWGALHRGNVPIIMAGSHDTLIPNSYIDVMDFKTVKDLVMYLRYLDKNNAAYMKYFDWRRDFEIDFSPRDSIRNDIWLPQFCDILMTRDWSRRKIVDISDFYSVEKNCPQDKTKHIMELVRRGI